MGRARQGTAELLEGRLGCRGARGTHVGGRRGRGISFPVLEASDEAPGATSLGTMTWGRCKNREKQRREGFVREREERGMRKEKGLEAR